MIWETKKLLLFIPLILVLDLFLLIDINKKTENNQKVVLGTQTFVKRKISAKKNPPKIDLAYIEKKYPTLTLMPTTIPTIIKKSNEEIQITTTPTPALPSAEVQTSSQSNSIIISGNSLIDQINKFRSSNGKSSISENNDVCSFASTRASEIVNNFNHDGFSNRANSKTLPYPNYSEVAENIAMNGDVSKVVPGWIDSPGHRENLLKELPFGCVKNSGNYYVYEAWKP